jgi:hypothetical protein
MFLEKQQPAIQAKYDSLPTTLDEQGAMRQFFLAAAQRYVKLFVVVCCCCCSFVVVFVFVLTHLLQPTLWNGAIQCAPGQQPRQVVHRTRWCQSRRHERTQNLTLVGIWGALASGTQPFQHQVCVRQLDALRRGCLCHLPRCSHQGSGRSVFKQPKIVMHEMKCVVMKKERNISM